MLPQMLVLQSRKLSDIHDAQAFVKAPSSLTVQELMMKSGFAVHA